MSFKNKQASKYGEKSNMATTSRMNSQADMTTDPPRKSGLEKNIEQGSKTIPLGDTGKGYLSKDSDGLYYLMGTKDVTRSVADEESLRKQYEKLKKQYPDKFN
jgi:hypothetical protein